MQGHLPCSFVTLALLGSYALQSELGEYDPEVHGTDYAKDMKMVHGQTKELEDKMMELHQTYRLVHGLNLELHYTIHHGSAAGSQRRGGLKGSY